MEGLDLSFVGDKKQAEEKRKTGGLDLSFVGHKDQKPTLGAVETAQKIVNQRDQGGVFPQGDRHQQGTMEAIGNLFTGNDRETPATENLPEIGSEMGLKTLLGDKATLGAAATLLTTTDPVEFIKILQNNTDEPVTVRPDEAGNLIVGVGGREGILNKPGFSKLDLLQLGGLSAAFFPSGKIAQGAKGIVGAMVRGGSSAAATQTAIEGAQSAQGGDFNASDVGVAGLTPAYPRVRLLP